MPDKNLEKLRYESFIKMIENSEGSTLFNTYYVKNTKDNKVFDVLGDGHYSCAFYVGSILTIHNLLERPHATVATTINKIKEFGFEGVPVGSIQSGDVVRWEDIMYDDGSIFEHIGFYLAPDSAYSTSWQDRCVIKHHPTFGVDDRGNPVRKIVAAYRYPFKI